MEPLEFEAERGRSSRPGNRVRRPGAHESPLLTDPGRRPGGGHSGRGTGPHAPARQRYPGGTAPQWPPAYPPAANRPAEPYGDGGNAYGYDEDDRGYSYGYGDDDGYGNGNDAARPARDQPAARGYRPRQGTLELRNGNSVSMAARILSVADYEAASITQQAALQATVVTQRVAYEATGIREAARREADQLMQQASLQAAAVREAAEIEAAEVHIAVTSMQTELSELAERIRNTLPHPVLPPDAPPAKQPAARPAIGPATRPPTGPQARPRTGPQERPAGGTGARPRTGPQERLAGKPAARATGKPGTQAAQRPPSGQGRQAAAMRFAVIATSALFLVAVAAGAVEIHLHGWKFFIFRSTGTGETGQGPGSLQENQGPGQPDAPKATPSQIKVQPSSRTTVTVRSSH